MDITYDQQRAIDLETQRAQAAAQKKKKGSLRATAKKIKTAAKAAKAVATPLNGARLATKIQISDFFLYLPAFVIALAKDASDIFIIGSIPVIGTVISICASITIGLIFLLAGSRNQQFLAKTTMRWVLVLLGGTAIEALLFGVNFLPIEVITVFIAYIFVLKDRDRTASEYLY